MIATLQGTVSEKLSEGVVLDVHGVGYAVYITNEDYGQFSVGQSQKVYIYEHIREQLHDLYGFTTLETKYLFEQLLDVTGVGPKMAVNVLSVGTGQEVRHAIAGGEVKFIQQANGVGKRVAERIIVELKDKVGLAGVDLTATGLLQSDVTHLKDEAVQALVSLGYTTTDAVVALDGIDPQLPTAQRVKQALRSGAAA